MKKLIKKEKLIPYRMVLKSQKYNFFQEVKNDFIFSFQQFKEFWRSFISLQIFSIALGFVSAFIILLSYLFIFKTTNIIFYLFILLLLGQFLMIIFLSCHFGLAFDILGSGNMVTEFKSGFKYFFRYWKQYLFFGILINIINFIYPPQRDAFTIQEQGINLSFSSEILTLFTFFQFIWFLFFIMVFPSITYQGSFIKAFKENFYLLRTSYKRLIITWSLYFLIFELPIRLLGSMLFEFIDASANLTLFFSAFSILFIISMSISFLIFPMRALIATRIYNTIMISDEV